VSRVPFALRVTIGGLLAPLKKFRMTTFAAWRGISVVGILGRDPRAALQATLASNIASGTLSVSQSHA